MNSFVQITSKTYTKQKIYLRQAGNKAKRLYHNQESIKYFLAYFDTSSLQAASLEDEYQVKFALAEVLEHLGQWAESKALYKEITEQKSITPELQGRGLIQLGHIQTVSGEYAQALTILDHALHYARELEDASLIMGVMKQLSLLKLHQNDYPDAIAIASELHDVAIDRADLADACEAKLYLSWAYIETGDTKEALAHALDALSNASTIDYKRGIINASNDLAGIYSEMYQYEKSLHYCGMAIKYSRQIGNYVGLAQLYSNSAYLYIRLGWFDFAHVCLRLALEMLTPLKDSMSIVNAVSNMANLFAFLSEFDLAQKLYEIVIEITDKLENDYFLCLYWHQYAQCLEMGHKLSEAMTAAQQALEAANKMGLASIALQAQALLTSLEFRSEKKSKIEALTSFASLLQDSKLSDVNAAEIRYRKWLIDPAISQMRNEAEVSYRDLLSIYPSHLFLSRYSELLDKPLDKFMYLSQPFAVSEEIEAISIDTRTLFELALYALNSLT